MFSNAHCFAGISVSFPAQDQEKLAGISCTDRSGKAGDGPIFTTNKIIFTLQALNQHIEPEQGLTCIHSAVCTTTRRGSTTGRHINTQRKRVQRHTADLGTVTLP